MDFDRDNSSNTIWCAVTSAKNTRALKVALEQAQLCEKSRKIFKLSGNETAIPLKPNSYTREDLGTIIDKLPARVELIDINPQLKRQRTSPREKLICDIKQLMHISGMKWSDVLAYEIPSHWEQHGDLILIPGSCFSSDVWFSMGDKLWSTVAIALGVKRLAKNSAIKDNDFRSPKVTLLIGQDGWVTHADNGIKYTFDVTKCMFSSGNITEKMRIGNMDCSGQVVVDLYAGIGYFVLPYLVQARAAMVHACEWNPDAVEALQRNLRLNKVAEKCKIYAGDNRKFPHKGIADHVNLGLIPSSENAWSVACRALRPDIGGWLHIHGNVTSASIKHPWGSKNEDETGKGQPLVCCHHKLEREGDMEPTSNKFVGNSSAFLGEDQQSDLVFASEDPSTVCSGGVDESISSGCFKDAKGQIHTGDGDKRSNSSHACYKLRTDQLAAQNSNNIKDSMDTPYSTTAAITKSYDEQSEELPSCNKAIKQEWLTWSKYVTGKIGTHLSQEHSGSDISYWKVKTRHIEHVKSYAPRVDHLVLDIECRPILSS